MSARETGTNDCRTRDYLVLGGVPDLARTQVMGQACMSENTTADAARQMSTKKGEALEGFVANLKSQVSGAAEH